MDIPSQSEKKSFPDYWITTAFFSLLAGILFLILLERVDPDYFWRLKHGELMVREGIFPMRDMFSFTVAGERTIVNAWVGEILIYAVHNGFGYLGQALFHAILLTTAHFMLYVFLTRKVTLSRTGSLVLTALCALNFYVITGPRVQNFSFIFFMATLFLVHKWENGDEKAPYQIALLIALWVNLHSGFVIALVVLLLIALGKMIEDRRFSFKAFAPFFAGLAASCVNPEGYNSFYLPVYSFIEPLNQELVQEMKPLEILQPSQFIPYFTVLALLMAFGLGAVRRRRFPWWLLCLALAYQSMQTLRMIPFFALVGVIVAGFALKDAEKIKPPRWIYASLFLVFLGMTSHYTYLCAQNVFPWNESRIHEVYPHDSVRVIKQKYPGKNVFSTFNWGGYLLYHLYPDNLIAIDSRTMPYLDFLRLVYVPVMNASPQSPWLLDQIKADLVLVPPDSRIFQDLSKGDGWETALKTPTEGLLLRKR